MAASLTTFTHIFYSTTDGTSFPATTKALVAAPVTGTPIPTNLAGADAVPNAINGIVVFSNLTDQNFYIAQQCCAGTAIFLYREYDEAACGTIDGYSADIFHCFMKYPNTFPHTTCMGRTEQCGPAGFAVSPVDGPSSSSSAPTAGASSSTGSTALSRSTLMAPSPTTSSSTGALGMRVGWASVLVLGASFVLGSVLEM